jgi:hypothetical protein
VVDAGISSRRIGVAYHLADERQRRVRPATEVTSVRRLGGRTVGRIYRAVAWVADSLDETEAAFRAAWGVRYRQEFDVRRWRASTTLDPEVRATVPRTMRLE